MADVLLLPAAPLPGRRPHVHGRGPEDPDAWTFVVLYFHEAFPLRAVYAAPGFVLLGGGHHALRADNNGHRGC